MCCAAFLKYHIFEIEKNNESILVDLSGIEKSEYKLKDKVNIRFKNIIDL